MNIIFVLISCVTHCIAMCITVLTTKESLMAQRYPARVWKWNRYGKNFDLLEALNQNGTAICSVDYIDDLTEATILVSGEIVYPYVMMKEGGGVTGYIGDIWTTLEQALKFRSVYRKGRSLAGESLITGEAQVWLAATTVQTYPAGHYSYSPPLTDNYYGLFVLSERTHVSKWWYTSIFSQGLWSMAFIFVVGITGLLLVMYRFKRAVCHNYIECHHELALPSFNFLCVLGVITGQGFQKIPTSWSLRFLIISAVIMGMMISCGFSSTLTSYLAIRRNYLTLNSLEDIAQQKTHSLCVRNDSGAYFHLTESVSQDAPLKKEWKGLVNKNCPDMNNERDFAAKMCKPGFVYLEAPDLFLSVYRRVQYHCRLVQIPGVYWSLKIAFLHARSAPHRRVINNYILRLRSAGILKYLERKWISRELPNSNELQWGFKPVEYAHIHLISLALFTMMLVSLLICVIENIWFRVQSRREKTVQVLRRSRHSKLPHVFPANKLDPSCQKFWAINRRM